MSDGLIERQGAVRVSCLLQVSDRRKRFNQYVRGERIGKGKHGEVYLCQDLENQGELAMKVVKRSSPRDRMKMLRRSYQQSVNSSSGEKGLPMNSTEHAIRKEIIIMKKCRHPNLVRLFEVIDDPQQDKIYLIMEYLAGGPIEWTNGEQEPILLVDQTRRVMRDVIVGLDYLHHQGIIHRDIKPANLLWSENRTTVKIIDFGISHYCATQHWVSPKKVTTDDDDDLSLFPECDLRRRVGTPSFLAPEVVWFDDYMPRATTSSDFTPSSETVKDVYSVNTTQLRPATTRPPITKAIDVWSLAVTFYCFLFGRTPFNLPPQDNENIHHKEFVLYHQICTQDWMAGDTIGADRIRTGGRHPQDKSIEGSTVMNLLDKMLQKDPGERITLGELKRHPWFLCHIANPEEWLEATSPTSSAEMPLICRWARRMGRKILDILPGSRHSV
ncbi:hypothetical protein AMATHDRAFT_142422 [Amanita thiersii Skay4041]|uniref:Protein kinase domain-containing protein n=1 Tax=Amanita thiersii Skay4041 TaxID=703135 RepID=A0A2A9NKR2_9AGAR|nr:hypothetical protein AMATHDRAFT_142422 [Amanita thiersii Skay4041]